MDELNQKILRNFRENIAISNLEEELKVKKGMKKQVLMLSIMGFVCLFGGFLTVDAATGGEITEKVKDTIKVVLIREDGKEEVLKGISKTSENGHTIETYYVEGEEGAEYRLDVDKTELEEENLGIDGIYLPNKATVTIQTKEK